MIYMKNLAAQIPDKIRRERLLIESDPIGTARPYESDKKMQLLLKVWFQYIEPHKEASNCPICLANVLSSFQNLKPLLMEIEEDYQKLNSL